MPGIGVVGLGHVGSKMVRFYENHLLATYDVADPGPYPAHEFARCDLIFICVDTPCSATGLPDVSNVEAAVRAAPRTNLIIKSTIPPGTTERLSAETGKAICVSPEYVGE